MTCKNRGGRYLNILNQAQAAAAWSPTDLGSILKGWWDFSDASTLYTDAGTTPVSSDSDLIYQANDLSGNNHHLIQATSAARPVYRTAVANGLSMGEDNGTASCAMATASTVDASIDDFCMVTVCKATAVAGAHVPYCIGGTGNGASFYIVSSVLYGFVGGQYAISAGAANTNLAVLILRRSGGTSHVYRNGGTSLGNSTQTPTSMGTTKLFAFDAGTGGFDGHIGEAYHLSGESLADLNTLGSYLADKWGLTWSDIS